MPEQTHQAVRRQLPEVHAPAPVQPSCAPPRCCAQRSRFLLPAAPMPAPSQLQDTAHVHMTATTMLGHTDALYITANMLRLHDACGHTQCFLLVMLRSSFAQSQQTCADIPHDAAYGQQQAAAAMTAGCHAKMRWPDLGKSAQPALLQRSNAPQYGFAGACHCNVLVVSKRSAVHLPS